jgi:hypothetical protein
MSEQRELIHNPHRSWVLSEEVRRTGLEGVRQARAALRTPPSDQRVDEEHRPAA